MAEPVSTCVQEILLARPRQAPRLVTKLKMPPLPSLSPGYQFCTVEYLICDFSPSGHQFDHGGMQLVLVADRGRAAFQIADVGPFLGDDQRPLELARFLGVDAEIGGQLHRAPHALGDVGEGAVAEHGRVEGGEDSCRCKAPPSRDIS